MELEIFWSRLIQIVDEGAVTLRRTAFSPVAREALDFAVVLLDRDGGSVAQSNITVPGFIGTLPRTVRHFLAKYRAEEMAPGDIIITNDPWMGTGHLPDLNMAMPIFHRDRIIGFAACSSHLSDVGGRIWSGDSREVFEEGLRIPPTKLVNHGRWNETLLDVISANVRVPNQVLGDMHAQVAAMEACRQRLLTTCLEYDVDDPTSVFHEIQSRSEAAMERVIRALPEGEYASALELDSLDEPLHVNLRLTVRGGRIVVDYAGSSPQTQEAAINCPYTYTFALTMFPLKCLLHPTLPNNEGVFRRFEVRASEGSLVNATFPAAVNSRHATGQYLVAGLFAAMEQVAPDLVVGDPGAPASRCVFSGQRPDGGRFSEVLLASGGMGAARFKDGLSCTAFPSNCGISSIEMIEQHSPLLFHCKELVPDSGGAGRFRGGLGARVVIELLSERPAMYASHMVRLRLPALGRVGGLAGGLAGLRLNSNGRLPPLGRVMIAPGDRVSIGTPGGGGYGRATERDVERVMHDLEGGIISPMACRAIYGVDPTTGSRVSDQGSTE
ncbi:MAG: hydantoinase B/oxoprolinase family protein [Candidatus Rokubacteria bacterium]|nr:hydantoinase B/oxoprolinase family protein [Candidatus Rokubacteria bacterium]